MLLYLIHIHDREVSSYWSIHHHVPWAIFAIYQTCTRVITHRWFMRMTSRIAPGQPRSYMYSTCHALYNRGTIVDRVHTGTNSAIASDIQHMNKLIMCILFHSCHFPLLQTHVPENECIKYRPYWIIPFCYEKSPSCRANRMRVQRIHHRSTQHATFPVWFLRHMHAHTHARTCTDAIL